MLTRVRSETKTIAVAAATAVLTTLVIAGAPAVAHGVQHALFAHNAGKLDGKGPAAFLARNEATSVSVLSDGSRHYASHAGTTSERTSTGQYTIMWSKKIKMPDYCGEVVTPFYFVGDPFHATVSGFGNTLFVQIYNEAGEYADAGFNAIAVC